MRRVLPGGGSPPSPAAACVRRWRPACAAASRRSFPSMGRGARGWPAGWSWGCGRRGADSRRAGHGGLTSRPPARDASRGSDRHRRSRAARRPAQRVPVRRFGGRAADEAAMPAQHRARPPGRRLATTGHMTAARGFFCQFVRPRARLFRVFRPLHPAACQFGRAGLLVARLKQLK